MKKLKSKNWSFIILFSGLMVNDLFYMNLKRGSLHYAYVSDLLLFMVRSFTTVFFSTLFLFLIVFFIMWIIRLFKKRWLSFVIPSIIITILNSFVITLATKDEPGFDADKFTSEWRQSYPLQDTNVTTKVENKEAKEKLEINEPVTGLKQEQYSDTVPGDEQLTKSMIGVWKEFHQQDCLDGESLVIYYPDMKFEEHTTYKANEDCEFLSDGVILKAGEFRYKVSSGTWSVRDGYVYYKTLLGKISSMRIISVDSKRASLIWDSGNTCEAYRIDFHNEELFKRKDEPGVDADGNIDIYKEQSTSSLYQEDSIHFSKIAKAHPDYEEIASDPKFTEYINGMPYLERTEAERIVESETAGVIPTTDEINILSTRQIGSSVLTEYERNDHVYKVLKSDPVYLDIADSQKFKDYVNNLPLQQYRTASRIIESGTEEEIIELISNYKSQEDYQESHRLMIKKMIENYSALDKSRAINILQDWINKVENNAKVISLSVKDSSTHRYDQKYIVTYTISKGPNQNEFMYEYNLITNAIQRMVYLHDED